MRAGIPTDLSLKGNSLREGRENRRLVEGNLKGEGGKAKRNVQMESN